MSEENQEKPTGTKGARLIIAGIMGLFVVFVLFRIFFDESVRFAPLSIKGSTLIFGLWIVIILFCLTFLFILGRNLLKMYYEKKREHVGIGFKNRLVLFFIAFSIVPSLLLFFFATDLISRSIQQWFKPSIETIVQNVDMVRENYYNTFWSNLDHFTNRITDMVKEKKMWTDENRIYLKNRLTEKMVEYKLDVISVYRNEEEIISIINPMLPIQEYSNLPLETIYQGLGEKGVRKIDPLKKGELLRNGVSFKVEPEDRVLIVTGSFIPESYASNLAALTSIVTNYAQQKELRDPVKNTYILLFLFFTILIIFAASWLGFYLARDITIPIDKLAAATSEIAKGNLDVQIDYAARDEFGSLITEFNRMARDLKENRDKLTRRTVELRHRRSIIEHILRNITSGVMALNSRGEIIEINLEAAHMLSLETAGIRRKSYQQVIPENLYPDIHAMIAKAYEARFKILEKEIDIKLKGKVINLAVKITQLKNPINNRFAGLLVVMTDLSDLIKAQRTLVWREVAKRVAHEIKNPLTPIQISSQRILRSLDQPDAKFRGIVEDSLNIVLQEIDSIKKLADEFSNFARLPEIKFGQGDVNLILENLISVYASIYQSVKFHAKLDVELPAMIKLDSEQMKRVFVNIIDNSVEAMQKSGEIEIITRYNEQSKFMAVEIADNGPGIGDEDKQKLFIPYFSQKSSGTGLGLAIAHNIVEEHNGLISVIDNPPHGVRFIIEIPA